MPEDQQAGLLRAARCARRTGLPRRVAALARADPSQHRADGPGGRGGRGRTQRADAVPRIWPPGRARPEPQLAALRLPGAAERAAAERRRRSSRSRSTATLCSRPTSASWAQEPEAGVMAGVLAGQGLKVVVLEAGGYFDESDFTQLELPAYQNLFWRGGPTPTADMNVSLQAGSCLGGGTVINWTNSLRTTPWVREQWEHEFGLQGLAGSDFDAPYRRRLGAPRRQRPLLGAERPAAADEGGRGRARLELCHHQPQHRPATLLVRDRRLHGLRRSERLQAVDDQDLPAGRPRPRRCDPHALLGAARPARGRQRQQASQAAWADPESGRSASVTVHAPQVVVACGSLESPALLLRSGIGGPAAGDYLRLHPCTAVLGLVRRGPAGLARRASRRARARVRERAGRPWLPDRGRPVHDGGRRRRRCPSPTAPATSG